MSFLPWKGNWLLQPTSLSDLLPGPILDTGESSEKLPLLARTPGMASGQEELTPLCSSPVWPAALLPWSQPRGTGILVYGSLFQNRAWSGAHERYGNLCVGVQQARMSSDLRPASTEKGQANELGWESPECSCVATYFAEWQIEGGTNGASYTPKGHLKIRPRHSPSQRSFLVLNSGSKFLLLWIRDFWCSRDSQGLLP